ncbi:MAG: hypothetical protein NVS3B21_32790 [Acidimicrobiales bacterium]
MKLSHAAGASYSNVARGVVTRQPPVKYRSVVAILEGEGLLERVTVVGPGDLIDLVPGESFSLEATSPRLVWVVSPVPTP